MTVEVPQPLDVAGVLIVEQGGRGGCTDYTACLAAALAELGIPVTIATATDHLIGELPGVRIVRLFRYVRGTSAVGRAIRRLDLGWAANGLLFLLAIPRLVALARRHAVVHVQGWERHSLGVLATVPLILSGARIVYTAHNTFERRPHPVEGRRLFPRLARETIVHTETDRRRIDPGRSVTVIPHGHYGSIADGVPAVEPAAARMALDLPADLPVVLIFGVLRPDKGIGDLLDAVAQTTPWHALIAGEEDGALAAAAAWLSSPALAGRVTVREGFQQAQDVGDVFAAADLVALPYRQASQSGVLHLAYGFARPVVAYPVGGLIEAVQDGVTGWLCTEASPAALAEVLRVADRAGRDELRRMGEEGRRWATETFDWRRIAAATAEVYRRALLGRSW